MGFVVWPSDTLPTYQITPVEDYTADRVRKPGLSPVDLDAAVKRAREMLDLAPRDYAVFVVAD